MRVEFLARVISRAKKSEMQKLKAGVIRVRVTAPPVHGKANQAVIEFLAQKLKIPKQAISILFGEHSRNKKIAINGLSENELYARLFGQEKMNI